MGNVEGGHGFESPAQEEHQLQVAKLERPRWGNARNSSIMQVCR